MEGFKDFIKEQGVVAFATAFAIGAALAAFVSDLVDGIVSPIIGAITGGENALADLSVEVGDVTMVYGKALSSFIFFLATAAVVYILVKVTGADKWDKK